MAHSTPAPRLTGPDSARPAAAARRLAPARPAAMLACAAGLLAVAPADAWAGATLLSRESTITAAGVPGDAAPDAESVRSFDRFAGQVGTGDAPVDGIVCLAHQYSVPGTLGVSGAGLEGAFGEGQVRAGVSTPTGAVSADSGMDLLFAVEGRPVRFEVGASMGASGQAKVMIDLSPVGGAEPGPSVFSAGVDGDGAGPQGAGRSVAEDGLLEPGQYRLRVWADADDAAGDGNNSGGGGNGDPAEGNAYYNFTFRVADAGTPGNPPAAVPLPPAALAGGGMLGLMAARRLARRLRLAA